MCLVSNTKITIGLLFDKEGNLIKKSSLIFEEEDEVNDYCKELKPTKFNYIENIKTSKENTIRIEKEKKDILLKYINNKADTVTLKYLYYEYYKKECNNKTKIKQTLNNELNKNWSKKQNNLYQLVSLFKK